MLYKTPKFASIQFSPIFSLAVTCIADSDEFHASIACNIMILSDDQRTQIDTFVVIFVQAVRIRLPSTSITFRPTKAANRSTPIRLPPANEDLYDEDCIRLEKVVLTSELLVSLRAYCISLQNDKEIEFQIKRLLEANIIESSHSPYAATETLVMKKCEG
ncbi:hypothetical protein NPIL_693651 [Nephila pilipes]|uniref:Uncharacterized protein n=1 Tax=Nephila pilipes TaxID=299642 RepID=A0A8X6PRT0_NEPPI|nr:hypothetical protein NPIL_693651 [Nephila pilipes]